MLLALFLACATAHHDSKGTEFDVTSDAYGARLMVDGQTAASAVAKADGKVPVTVSTTVRSAGGRSSTTNVTVGAPSVPTAYASSAQLDQAAAAAMAYRAQWAAANGYVVSAPSATYRPPSQPVASASRRSSGGGSSTTVPPKAEKCPTDRSPRSQGEIDACQSQSISAILDTVGTVKGGAR